MKKDEEFIQRCIKLGEKSIRKREAPFGALVVKNGKIISEGGNMVNQEKDVTQHAEMRAILKAHRKLGFDLSECTLYTNCEPCPIGSFIIRELKFKRVVYSLRSPYMGGQSKWNILEDHELERFAPVFGKPPKVIGGVLKEKAMELFKKAGWGPMFEKKGEIK